MHWQDMESIGGAREAVRDELTDSDYEAYEDDEPCEEDEFETFDCHMVGEEHFAAYMTALTAIERALQQKRLKRQ